jgi:hypothetical protein
MGVVINHSGMIRFFFAVAAFVGLPRFGGLNVLTASAGTCQTLTVPTSTASAPLTKPAASHAVTVEYGRSIAFANSLAVIICGFAFDMRLAI